MNTNTTERPTWAVKCDACKTTIRRTENVRESYAGGTCDACRAKGLARVKMVSVRQQAAEQAEAAGRKPCAERSHPADCPGGCALPPALVMRDTSGSSVMSGRTYYLLCPGGEFLLDAEGRIQRFEREQEALDAAKAKGWRPIADTGLPRGREWAEAHDRVYTWKA